MEERIILLFKNKYPDRKITKIGKVGNTYGVLAPEKKYIGAKHENIPLDCPFFKISGNKITKINPFAEQALFNSLRSIK